MNDLASKQCVPCRGGVPPLKGAELRVFLREVNNGWQVIGSGWRRAYGTSPHRRPSLGPTPHTLTHFHSVWVRLAA
jgi:hypothetical protein